MKVFWSWQSDTPGKIGRHLVRDALNAAIERLKEAPDVEEPVRSDLHLDQDIEGTTGSPDLARTILDKIDHSNVVVADVTLADRAKNLINSNVALELGYALHAVTGTFATILKQRYPGIEVTGLDPDPRALARAKRKAAQGKISVRFDQGFADSLEYPAASFEVVFSSFMFHHLESSNREKTLREVRRVLKPGGSFYLLDFEVPTSGHGLFNLFHSGERLRDNTESRILALMGDAGFSDPRKVAVRPVLFGLGRAGYYQASAPR